MVSIRGSLPTPPPAVGSSRCWRPAVGAPPYSMTPPLEVARWACHARPFYAKYSRELVGHPSAIWPNFHSISSPPFHFIFAFHSPPSISETGPWATRGGGGRCWSGVPAKLLGPQWGTEFSERAEGGGNQVLSLWEYLLDVWLLGYLTHGADRLEGEAAGNRWGNGLLSLSLWREGLDTATAHTAGGVWGELPSPFGEIGGTNYSKSDKFVKIESMMQRTYLGRLRSHKSLKILKRCGWS